MARMKPVVDVFSMAKQMAGAGGEFAKRNFPEMLEPERQMAFYESKGLTNIPAYKKLQGTSAAARILTGEGSSDLESAGLDPVTGNEVFRRKKLGGTSASAGMLGG